MFGERQPPSRIAAPVASTQRYRRQPDNRLTLPAMPRISMIPSCPVMPQSPPQRGRKDARTVRPWQGQP